MNPGGMGAPGGGLTATAQFNTPVAPSPGVPPQGGAAGAAGGGGGGAFGAPPPPAGIPGVAPAAAIGASYTQMMQAPTAPQPSLLGQGQPGGPRPLNQPPPKKGIPPLVFIGAGLIVFLIIVAILVVVMKKPT